MPFSSEARGKFRSYLVLNLSCFATLSFEMPMIAVSSFSNLGNPSLNSQDSVVHPGVLSFG